MTRAAEAMELAARVAGAADLLDIRMLSSGTNLEKLTPQGDLSFSVEMSPKVERDDGSGFFVVRLRFAVRIEEAAEAPEDQDQESSIEMDDDSDDALVATAECEMAALYELVDLGDYEPTAEEFEAYAETSGTLSLFPYVREFVADATARLGLPKLTLPPHRLPSPWHPEADASED